MADIIKFDVRTYVEKLIKKEFSPKNNEEKVVLDKRKANADAQRDVQPSPILPSSEIKEQFQTWENQHEC
jgi:hypothetical protein